MYIHLHSHVLGNMLFLFFLLKFFWWMHGSVVVFTAFLRATQTTDSHKICTFLKGLKKCI